MLFDCFLTGRVVDPPQQRLVGLTEKGRHIQDHFSQGEYITFLEKRDRRHESICTSCLDVSGLVLGHYCCGCSQHSHLILWGETSGKESTQLAILLASFSTILVVGGFG